LIKRDLSKKQAEKEPHLIWNAFIDLIAVEEESELTNKQRIAHHVFWYDSEIQNGGHLQYFENHPKLDYSEVIESLNKVGAHKQAEILKISSKVFLIADRKPISSASEYSEIDKNGEYDEYDSMYYNISHSINFYLEKYLDDNLNEFINFN
jgi:hypothetical protein